MNAELIWAAVFHSTLAIKAKRTLNQTISCRYACGYDLSDFIYRYFIANLDIRADLVFVFCVEIQSELNRDNRFASQTQKLWRG